MSKVNIKRLDSVTKNDTTATEQINDNFQALQAAVENTVSRDGTVPNYMDADLDLNSYRIINAGDPVGERDVVNLKYFEEKAGGAIEAAAEAKASASRAASSAQSALVASNNAIGQLAQAEGLFTATEAQLENTKQYVDTAKANIDSTVAQAKTDVNSAIDEATMNISNIVSDAEGSITNIAVTEANKAIANAAQEATDTATANLNSYVDGTVKPSLQTYVDQAQEAANSAATSMEQAALSATAASNYANNASADADNAAESAGLAANSAAAAATSKTNAKASETNAKIWAEGTDAQVQALGGEKSAKGWAEASTNLDYTNITNCITEIPQDIKLELADGVLTLKAGSKVYDGAGNVINITGDKPLGMSSMNPSKIYFLFYDIGNASAYYFDHTQTFSGDSQPSSENINTYAVWFDTKNKEVKRTKDGGVTWISNISLPLAKFSADGSAVTSIDQVFNGFGYIGSTIFALPGVKGLIPNGRNADGSLKNIEFTTDGVTTKQVNANTSEFGIKFDDNYPAVGAYVYFYNLYDESTNTVTYNGIARQWMLAGSFVYGSSKITSFTPKTVFHAVDYDDFINKIEDKFQVVSAVPANPDIDTFYYIPV